MLDLTQFLSRALDDRASDLFFIPGTYASEKVNNVIQPIHDKKLMPEDIYMLVKQVYALADDRSMETLENTGDDDFAFSKKGLGRFRMNAYRQRGSFAAVLRCVSYEIPDPEQLHIPRQVMDLSKLRNGLVLVTGAAGSGKSTTLACLIDKINSERNGHIITLEDPIEFLHGHKKCIVSQREVKQDTISYSAALRAALRQSPNVILLGEMRDFETIQTALTAVETGQLLLSSLHTLGAAQTIDRIIDVFPAEQQQQVRMQLSLSLRAVVSQQLIPAVDGSVVPVFEIMIATPAIQNMIRDKKVFQMDTVIHSGQSDGMISMDSDILRLYKEGVITKENAVLYAINPDQIRKRLDERRL